MPDARFAYDPALVRELGERLTGDAAGALAELVKNAYDADARRCTVRFDTDSITVSDDGDGMSEDDFTRHWLRIGSTHKRALARSRRLGRPLAGAKGIGRLAAQVLARHLALESTSADERLEVHVDWTLADAPEAQPARWTRMSRPRGTARGTTLVLRALHEPFDAERIEALAEQLWTLRAPGSHAGEDFEVAVEAPGIAHARERFDARARRLDDAWTTRARTTLSRQASERGVAVTIEWRDGTRKQVVFRLAATPPVDEASVDIRWYAPAPRSGVDARAMHEALARHAGIAIHDAGFVAVRADRDPFHLEQRQRREAGALALLPAPLRTAARGPRRRLVGAVRVDTAYEQRVARSHPPLAMNAARTALIDNDASRALHAVVHGVLELHDTHVAAARAATPHAPSRTSPNALATLSAHAATIPEPARRALTRAIRRERAQHRAERAHARESALAMATLATAGMSAAALHHEFHHYRVSLGHATQRLRTLADGLADPALADEAGRLEHAAQRIAGFQSLTTPLLNTEPAEPVRPLRIAPIVDVTLHAMGQVLRGLDITRDIDPELHFPPGRLEAWCAALQNVLANAWNALLDRQGPRAVHIDTRSSTRYHALRVHDNGRGLAVTLPGADVLFEPLERRLEVSAENRSLQIGGQGMGLAIVRMIAWQAGATTRFVRARPPWSTTVELRWRAPRANDATSNRPIPKPRPARSWC